MVGVSAVGVTVVVTCVVVGSAGARWVGDDAAGLFVVCFVAVAWGLLALGAVVVWVMVWVAVVGWVGWGAEPPARPAINPTTARMAAKIVGRIAGMIPTGILCPLKRDVRWMTVGLGKVFYFLPAVT